MTATTQAEALIYGLLFAEVTIVLFAALLFLFLKIFNLHYKKNHIVYPSCDIDPACHTNFAWDKYGNGWIGDVLVISRKIPSPQDTKEKS